MSLLQKLDRYSSRPLFALGIALMAAALFAAAVLTFTHGDLRMHLLTYDVPIGVPFVAFLFDRAERRRDLRRAQWLVDAPTVALALTRSVVPVPLISGHALFLTYAFLTSRSWAVRLTAMIVMLDVAFFKLFVWNSANNFLGGIALGCAAAWLFHRLARQRATLSNP